MKGAWTNLWPKKPADLDLSLGFAIHLLSDLEQISRALPSPVKCGHLCPGLFPKSPCTLFCLFLLLFCVCVWLHHVGCRILVPRPGIEPGTPVVEAWSPKHWTTREVTGDIRDVGSIPGSERSPGGGHGNPIFLPRESHGQKSLAGYSPQVCKELDTTEAT